MDDKAQISLEYLIMVTMSLAIAAAVVMLATNLFTLKETLKGNIELIRDKTLGLK